MNAIFLSIIAIHLLSIVAMTIAIMAWKSAKSDTHPSLSIVVAAHNELENLKKLIPKLVSQQYPDFEIIIALDRCGDESKAYLQNQPISFVEVDSTPQEWDHKKFALTKGIEKAQGEWIVLTDADCIPKTNQWLTSISNEITLKRDIIIGVSPFQKEVPLLSKYIRFEGFMTFLLYTSLTRMYKPYMAVGRNLAIKKTFWHEKDGYESIKNIKGGDDDLFIQMNASKKNTGLCLGSNSLVETRPKTNLIDYWNQKTRHFSVSKYYDKSSSGILSIFHIFHGFSIVSIIFLANTSLFLPLILIYLFIKLGSYRFVERKIGAGFNYIVFPFVDIIYAMITPILGISSQLKKDIKWKN